MTFWYPACDLIAFSNVDLPLPFGPATTMSRGTSSHFAYLMLRWFRISKEGIRTLSSPGNNRLLRQFGTQ